MQMLQQGTHCMCRLRGTGRLSKSNIVHKIWRIKVGTYFRKWEWQVQMVAEQFKAQSECGIQYEVVQLEVNQAQD